MATEIKIKTAIAADQTDLVNITIDGKTLAELGATINGTVITLAGYGTFDVTTAKKLIFTAEAGLAAGEYTFVDLASNVFTKIDLSKATNAVTVTGPTVAATEIIGGSGADSLHGAVAATKIVGGAGNDTLSGIGASELTGGEGADTFNVIAANIVKDYDYSQGDVLKDAACVITAVTTNGTVTGLATTSVKSGADNVFKAKVVTTAATTEYWTAAAGKSVKMDASALATAAVLTGDTGNDTLIGGAGKDVITTGTGTNEVWAGAGADSIVAAAANTTVWFGAGDGFDTVKTFTGGIGANDNTVYLYGTSDLADVRFSDATNITMNLGSDRLVLEGVADGALLKVKLADNTVKNVAVGTNAAKQTITADSTTTLKADYVTANAANSTVKYANYTGDLVVNLQDTSAYKNIDHVSIASAANSTVIGKATASVITLGTGTNAVWGGGAGNDTITSDAAGNDTIWYGGSYDGADSVSDFTPANDTVYFWDMSLTDVLKKSKITAAAPTNALITFDDKNSLKLDGALAAGANTIKVKGATDTEVTKLSFSTVAGGVGVNYAADTKLYVNSSNAGKLNVAADEATIYLDNLTANVATGDVYTVGYDKITGTAAGNYKFIGNATTNNTITGGTGNTAMWGGGRASDTFVGNTGVDTVWFGAGDGFDQFNTVGAEDTVLFWSATSINDVKATFENDKLIISTATGDQLNVGATADVLGTMTFQVGVNAEGGKYTFDTEAKAFVAKK